MESQAAELSDVAFESGFADRWVNATAGNAGHRACGHFTVKALDSK
jgi:hypothetical protein